MLHLYIDIDELYGQITAMIVDGVYNWHTMFDKIKEYININKRTIMKHNQLEGVQYL